MSLEKDSYHSLPPKSSHYELAEKLCCFEEKLISFRQITLINEKYCHNFVSCLFPELKGSSEKKILQSAACKWLNSPVVHTDHNAVNVYKNYERWSHEGRTKQKLKIGGIFPYSGNKYVAPELMPG